VPAVVYTEHVMCHPATPEQGPYCHASWIRWLRSATAPLLSCTVAISTAVAKSLPRGSRLVKVIYNGVDLSAYGRLDPEQCRRGLREELALGAETVLLTTVGHLTPLKAYHVAIGALAELRQHGHDGAHLVLCGDGPERSALERQSTALGLHDVVHFLGWRNDIPRILTGSDVLVHTALEEGLGLSIIEAGAAGLPAVASRTGGIPEVTEDCVTGLLFEPGNPAALAAALTTLVSDPRRRAELGLRAQGRVRERFSLEACAGAYLRLYQSLTEGPALSAS
jgi:glycosyltransferase involved in cell wall biosynthesis